MLNTFNHPSCNGITFKISATKLDFLTPYYPLGHSSVLHITNDGIKMFMPFYTEIYKLNYKKVFCLNFSKGS